MTGRPPKSAKVLQMEGKSHRTKRELAQRRNAEEAQLTGRRIREEARVKADTVAHGEFLRVTRILKAIEKDDDIYGAEINLYCELKSEIETERERKEQLNRHLKSIFAAASRCDDLDARLEYEEKALAVMKQIDQCDKKIDQRRRMRMDIEKNNLMNIVSSLRSIPKTVEKKKNPLAEALSG